jgi:hypothetical protein
MAANTSLCNVFSHVINAAFNVTCGVDVADVIGELIMLIRDKVAPEEFDAIQTALMNIELQVDRPAKDVRMVIDHSVLGTTPEGRRMITPTSEAAYNKLLEMGFKSRVESVVYDANRSVPTIIEHRVVTVRTVIPGFDSIEC